MTDSSGNQVPNGPNIKYVIENKTRGIFVAPVTTRNTPVSGIFADWVAERTSSEDSHFFSYLSQFNQSDVIVQPPFANEFDMIKCWAMDNDHPGNVRQPYRNGRYSTCRTRTGVSTPPAQWTITIMPNSLFSGTPLDRRAPL